MKGTLASVAAVSAGILLANSASFADHDRRKEDDFAARLSGFNEVHFVAGPPAALRGAISTAAKGSFKAEIDDRKELIHYELTFEGLEGDVTQAHIHFGQRSTVGGIVIWLCQTAGTPAPAAVAAVTPQCFAEGGNPRANTVTGIITRAQVLAQAAQGIEAEAFEEIIAAIRAGATYANVHSALLPPGEIRGHIDPRIGHGHH